MPAPAVASYEKKVKKQWFFALNKNQTKMANPHGNPQWGKGTSGNPKGRPKKGDAWADIIAEMLDQVGLEIEPGKPLSGPARRVIIKNAIARAIKGDNRMAEWLADRESGKPRQIIETPDLNPGTNPIKEALDKLNGEKAPENTDSGN